MGTKSKNLCVCYVISKSVKRIDGKIETSTVGYKSIYAKRNVANYAPLLFFTNCYCSLLQYLDLKIYLLQHKQAPLQSV